MLPLLFVVLATVATPQIEARLVSTSLLKTSSIGAGWRNRIDLELVSGEEQTLRLCPNDASVATERRVGASFAPVETFRGHAMRLGRDYGGSCRAVTLSPNQPQVVSFYIRGIPGRRRAEDRYTTVIQTGALRFAFVEAREPN